MIKCSCRSWSRSLNSDIRPRGAVSKRNICGSASLFLTVFFLSPDRLAAKLAKKESLSMKLQQRPGRQELIDRNILFQVIAASPLHCLLHCFLFGLLRVLPIRAWLTANIHFPSVSFPLLSFLQYLRSFLILF